MEQLRAELRRVGERRWIWLEGVEAEVMQNAAQQLFGKALWVGNAPEGVNAVTAKAALRQLGQECDTLVINAYSGLNPDMLGATVGTLRAGGLLLLLTPPRADWRHFSDPDSGRYCTSEALVRVENHFIARLITLLSTAKTDLTLPIARPDWQPPSEERATPEQEQVIAGVMQVVKGHRRRPLVVSADRGRGKSAALGMAAARLIAENPQLKIAVTAPAQATVKTLLHYAPEVVGYIAPDRLLSERSPLDLLLIDEAAAIPAPLLIELLRHYARIVFATTEHGYEGTGLGFRLRVKKALDRLTPNWREVHLTQPIRWSASDPLEPLLFQLLALDAEAPPPPDAWQTLNLVRHSAAALREDEALLRAIFGLLILAHYQTSPSDLRALLDNPDLDIYALYADQQIVAVALVVAEGALDPALIRPIWEGKRRPAGHLLPQSLLAHCGFIEAGSRRYARVMRIAVHPQLQRRGLGGVLIQQLKTEYRRRGFDYLGSAFAAHAELLRFWLAHDFSLVRLGLSRDGASGSHSAFVLQPLHDKCVTELQRWRDHFCQELPPLLATALRELETDILPQLWNWHGASPQLTAFEVELLDGFALALRPWATTLGTVQRYLIQTPKAFLQLAPEAQQLLLAATWQGRGDEALVRLFKLDGRNALLTRLRQIVTMLLT